MNTSFPKTIIFSFLALVIMLGMAQPAAAQGYGSSDPAELKTFLDGYIAEQMDMYHIPCVVITFVKDGKVFLSKGYSYADIELQTPFDDNTLLTTASLGKAFTAIGVSQLNERGVIDIDEDIRPCLWGWPGATAGGR